MGRKIKLVVLALVMLTFGVVAPAGAADGPPVSQTSPTIGGSLRVGVLLTASPGDWSPEPASYRYQWLRDDVPVSGAQDSTYRLVGADRGHRMAIQVIGVGADETPGAAAISPPTAVVAAGRFALQNRPTITGSRRWDHVLKVSTGAWAPKPTSVSYQWLREGKPIKGATKAAYGARLADFGKHLTVRVAVRRADYANGVANSFTTAAIDHRVGVRKHFTYSIATRGKITASTKRFATLAAESYADPRGWRSAGYEFERVAKGGDFTLVLSSAPKVPSFGSPCSSTWSCRVGRYVIINQNRWLHASPAWNKADRPLRDYRHMVINHETGHWLGHRHKGCPGKGKVAPIMMQQSKGLNGCRFNPFPLPSERWTSR
jgi:hypothetical protein